MPLRARSVALVLGVMFTLQGVAWIIAPATSAAGLGMPLLDGLARSTQVGDFSAFFVTAGTTILLGLQPGWSRILYAPAILLGSAALFRALAWALHGADFAALFIGVEVVAAGVLLAAARDPRLAG